ncbi:MAG: staygreen family protein [Clostridium sp.]
MFEFKPEKLFVDFKNGTENMEDVIPRVYTMTHSDETADLFVTVGVVCDYEKINENRDEVLAQWVKEDGEYKAKVYVQVDGKNGLKETEIRNEIFRRELPLALTAIRYADRSFFEKNIYLDSAPIIVSFKSNIDIYNKQENFGTFELYSTKQVEHNSNCEVNEKNKPRGKSKKGNKHKDKDIKTERVVPVDIKMQENVIRNLLNPYIQKEIWINYGRIQYFCLSEVEILSMKQVQIQSPCRRKYEVVVGIKVGQDPPPYNNMIIEFLVSSNSVTTRSVKNPK